MEEGLDSRIRNSAIFFAGGVCAQFQSSIEGTVTGATRASIPGAQVVLINEGTHVTQRATPSESGFFRITELPPGSYRIEVSHEGFKTYVETALVLQGSEVRTVYPLLAAGEGLLQPVAQRKWWRRRRSVARRRINR